MCAVLLFHLYCLSSLVVCVSLLSGTGAESGIKEQGGEKKRNNNNNVHL